MTVLAEHGHDARACSKCHEVRPVGDFSGRNNYCPPCRKAYGKAWRTANQEKVRAARAKDRANPEFRRRDFLRKHSLTPERFDELFDTQGRACAICRVDAPNGQGWHVDHDHACCPAGAKRRCGRCYRGILCHNCNVGLGMFKDAPERLLAAIHYLTVKV